MLLCNSLPICHVICYPSMGLSQVRDVSKFILLGCRFKSHPLHMNVYYFIFATNDSGNARLLLGNITIVLQTAFTLNCRGFEA
jgi:hypothetical protein